MTQEVKKDEDWMQKKWRPAMGWMYMVVCMMDMVVFPVAWSLLQTVTSTPITQWNPLTLQGAGLFHLAMGAVLGIAAFGRTQEKLQGANNGGAQLPAPTPAPMPVPATPVPSFGNVPLGNNSMSIAVATPDPTPTPIPAFGSKPLGPPAVAMPPI